MSALLVSLPAVALLALSIALFSESMNVEISVTKDFHAVSIGMQVGTLSYISSMAGGYVAYVGHVASQCVAMSAIWHPK